MLNLLNLSYNELHQLIVHDHKESKFRVNQLWQWLWHHGAHNFEQMTNLSKSFRDKLEGFACITWPEIAETATSSDGTIKFLLKLEDGKLIETVLIPSEARNGKKRMTQCLSTQVGCAMGCTFCSTGEQGFSRNLSQAEILGQVLIGMEYLDDFRGRSTLRNLVFMGMGEPLMNLSELIKSLQTLGSEQGLDFSRRRITVSTCGIKKGFKELGESALAYLAISLHAPNQKLREKLMPLVAKQWPLKEMLQELESYPLGTREYITFEYLLLAGVNDSLEEARELAKIARKLNAKINLICYNPAEGSEYKSPSPEQVLKFEKELWKHKIIATLRKSKGQDIKAACGQLKATKLG